LQTQDVQVCLEKDKNLHVRIRTHTEPVGYSPTAHSWEVHNGRIQDWLDSMILSKKAFSSFQQFQTCWRKVYVKDYISEKDSCSGRCIQTNFISNLPVIWTIRPDISDRKYWDFPLQLFPLSKAEAQKNQVVYELVARIYHSDDHFITSTIIPTTQHTRAVFVHDGIQHNGYSQILPGNVSELMAGTFPQCPTGYYPHAAIYKLKGGLGAQKRFQQVLEAKSKSMTEINLQQDLTGTLDSTKRTVNVGHTGHSHDYNLIPDYDFTTTKLGAIIKKQISRGLKTAETQEVIDVDFVMGEETEFPPNIIEESESIDEMILDTLNTKSNAHLVTHFPSESETGLFPAASPPLCSAIESDSSPPPSSPQHVLCRCGVESDGYREAIEQGTIQCSLCSNYTHASCITLRFSDDIPETFKCHHHGSSLHEFSDFITKLPRLRKQMFNTVSKRLL